jgi:uncharacterized protein (DUF2235 family)
MSKNIVVCSDGTGNTAIKGRGTNVFKLFEAVDLNGHKTDPRLTPQVAIYDDGVGTENFKPLKILGGAFGYGLARNVRQLYRELVRIYDPGDQIYLFGFSRGAFTVRTLAGMIHSCGILDIQKIETNDALHEAVDKAYDTYRKRYRTELSKLLRPERPDEVNKEFAEFRMQHSIKPEVKIRFLGVWDTVDAVGSPLHISDFINLTVHRFKFPDPCLNDSVLKACQALSIDDERLSFHPVLWANDPRIKQVWFAGVHSNVGGGYPKQGMSLVALDWMMQQASVNDLRFLPEDRELYREHANVDDKLYNSRSGVGIFYRWLPRDMKKLCEAAKVKPSIHISVLERIAHGTEDYAPGNISTRADVVITSTGDSVLDVALLNRAAAVQKVINASSTDSLLDKVRGQIRLGRLSYVLYVLFVAATVAILAITDAGPNATALEVLKRLIALIGNVVSLQFGAIYENAKPMLVHPMRPAFLGAGFLLSFALARIVDHTLGSNFSQFWHGEQQKLRLALKTVNDRARAHRSHLQTEHQKSFAAPKREA